MRPLIKGNLRFKARITLIYQWGVRRSCPCGGTYIDNSKYIKDIKIKRKNLGKTGQRVIMSFESSDLFQERFIEA